MDDTSRNITYEALLTQPKRGVLQFGGARMALLDIEAGFWGLRRQIEALVGRRLTDSAVQQAGVNGGVSFARSFAASQAGLQPIDADDVLADLQSCITAYQAAGFGQFELVVQEWPLGHLQIKGKDTFEAWMMAQHGQQPDSPACFYTAGVLVGFVNALTERRDVVCIQRSCQARGDDACLFELLPADEAGETAVVAYDPDPGLSRQLNLLEVLFERMPMGIAIFDAEFKLRRCNPTWADYIDRYTPSSAVQVVPGVSFFDLAPGTEANVTPILQQVINGETVSLEAFRSESGGIVSYWDVVFAPILEQGRTVGILYVTTDATRRVLAVEELQQTLGVLREREERLNLVLTGTNDGIWDWDLETDEVYFSPRWKSMLGYEEWEIRPHVESWRNLLHPDDVDKALAALNDHLENRTPFYRLEHRLRRKDGTFRWILARGVSVRDEDGRPVRLVGSHTDITDRKLAEEALRESEAHLRSVLESAKGFAVYRLSVSPDDPFLGQIILVSPSAKELLGVEDPTHFPSWFEPVHPDDRPRVEEANRRSAVEGVPFDETMRYFHQKRGEWRWFRTISNPVLDRRGRPLYFNGITIDITEQKRAEEELQRINLTLEQRVAERTQQLTSLLAVSHNVALKLELESLLKLILAQLQSVVDYDGASILVPRDGRLEVLAYQGPIPQETALSFSFAIEGESVNSLVFNTHEPVIIADVSDETSQAQLFRETAGSQLTTLFGYIRSWMGVPLLFQDRVLGMLTLDHREPNFYAERHSTLALAFANQVAVAMENAYLYHEEQERRQVAESLRDILAILNSNLPLPETLAHIIQQASRLLEADAAVIYHIDQEARLTTIEATFGMPEAFQQLETLPLVNTSANRATLNGQTYIVSNLQAAMIAQPLDREKLDPGSRVWIDVVSQHFSAYLSVPFQVKGRVYGDISLYYRSPRQFTDDEIELAVSFADQIALAVENTRLRIQVEESAASEERNRLARELHDAVTQTLFSASLIADVLPRLWERKPELGRERLEELRELTRGALAEMRTLLLELRPASLTESSLDELLRQLTEAVIGRSRIPITLTIDGQRPLPPEVQVAFYRIAQESLNNVVKHADASQAAIQLAYNAEQVSLSIEDDGRGFDVDRVPPSSLGLGIMRERGAKIGAELQVSSQIGRGTRVSVTWPAIGDGRSRHEADVASASVEASHRGEVGGSDSKPSPGQRPTDGDM